MVITKVEDKMVMLEFLDKELSKVVSYLSMKAWVIMGIMVYTFVD